MDQRRAEKFAEQWIAAWNAHDLERILSHYTDDFEMNSPYIRAVVGGDTMRSKGKTAVGSYWKKALDAYPDLHFELEHVLVGGDRVTLIYQGVRGLSAEVFFFDDNGDVYRAHAHYAGSN